jgi:hypothetical protein
MKNWNDRDILNYLMTSEFGDNLSTDELKFLLVKFRQYYRIESTKHNNFEIEKRKFDSLLEHLNNKLNHVNYEKNILQNNYDELFKRKLTWKERIDGFLKKQ